MFGVLLYFILFYLVLVVFFVFKFVGMDSQNYSGSRVFGENLNLYPSSRSANEQYRGCQNCHNFGHWTSDCHSILQPGYQEEHHGWKSTFEQPRAEPQGETSLTREIIGLIKSLMDAVSTNRLHHDQMLVDHAQRFEALERDKVCQEKVIEEQTKKIEQLEVVVNHEHFWRTTMLDPSINELKEQWRKIDQVVCSVSQETEDCKKLIEKSTAEINRLEADMVAANNEKDKSGKDELFTVQAKESETLGGSVDKLRTWWTSNQKQQTGSHNANLRRIKQLDFDVRHLREKLASVNLFLIHQQEETIRSRYCNDTSFDEEEDDIKPTTSTQDEKVACTPRTEDIPGTFDEQHRVPDVQKEEPAPTQHELTEGQGNASKKPSTTTSSTWEGDDTSRDLFEDLMPIDTPLDMNEFTDESSCDSCGLHCVPQLRACVKMIQVVPEIRKVKEKEVRNLKRTVKRKLQQQWVPRGVFDIKEQFKSDIINFEDKCAKSYLPRWKKRKQGAPIPCDSCD